MQLNCDGTKVDEHAALYRSIFDQHHTVMLVINPADGGIVHANAAASRYYGWTLAELVRLKITDINILPPEVVHAEMALAKRQQRNYFQFQHRLADGGIRDVESHSAPVPWGSSILLCSMITDVTERNRVAAELRQAKENLQQLVAERTEELTSLNEELTAQNEEIFTLNQNLVELNQSLEDRVEQRTLDLTAAHQELIAQYEEIQQNQMELQQASEVQTALREIAEAAGTADCLNKLYERVHSIVKRVLHAENVYIALLDEASDSIVRPYSMSEKRLVPRRRPVGKGWTEYVMRMGQTIHLTPSERERLIAAGEIELTIEACHEWLGAPLNDSQGICFGVLAFFTTDAVHAFKAEDKALLSIIAAQVSQAIQRKKAEEALAQSETLQKSILQAVPVGIGLVRNRIVQAVNERICRMTGYDKHELIGQSSRLFYQSQSEYERVGQEKYHQIRQYGSGTVETQWVCKDSSLIEVLLSSTPLDASDLDKGVTFTVLDITQRKRDAEAVRESEARYRAVIEQAPEAVFISDPHTGEIVEANSLFTQRFGYDLNRDASMTIYDLIVDSRQAVEAFLIEVRKTGFLPSQRRIVRHRNGRHIPVVRSTTKVFYRDRSLLVQTLRDISEEVRREEELRRDEELATRVQLALLQQAEASEFLDVTTIFEPHSYVGGDLYFMDWRYDGNLLRGFLVDATGHGLATALHTSAMHVLLREVNELDLPLPDQMRWLNRRASQYFDEATFAGALGFELDLQTRQLQWSCAGMPMVWLATRDKKGLVNCPGMYLGICSTESFELNTVSLSVGDSICFMTDGLSDIIGPLTAILPEKYEDMVEQLQKIAKSDACRDDATAICIGVKSLPNSVAQQDGWPRILRFNGYGDYQRLKGEVGRIIGEVTGKPHSMQEIAVNEALCNALECRDGVPRQHKARIRFNKIGKRLIVRVKTSRMGFAGNATLRRLRLNPADMFSFGEDAGMGRGIAIMLSAAHKMVYNSEGTEVLLVWKL